VGTIQTHNLATLLQDFVFRSVTPFFLLLSQAFQALVCPSHPDPAKISLPWWVHALEGQEKNSQFSKPFAKKENTSCLIYHHSFLCYYKSFRRWKLYAIHILQTFHSLGVCVEKRG
jgi:hypothetical protein